MRPSEQERKQLEREFLRTNGCYHEDCGVDDPDELAPMMPYSPTCIRYPSANEPQAACEDHDVPTEEKRAYYIQQQIDRYGDDVVAIAIYECGVVEPVKEPETTEIEVPHPPKTPRARIRHICGEPLKDVREINDGS